jgi:phage terminase large subunit-like protein
MEVTPLSMLLAAPTNIAARAYTSQPAANLATGLQTGIAPGTDLATQELLRRMLPVTGASGFTSLLNQ